MVGHVSADQLELLEVAAARARDSREEMHKQLDRRREQYRFVPRRDRRWVVLVEVETAAGGHRVIRSEPMTWTSAKAHARTHERMGRVAWLDELLPRRTP